MNVFWDAILKSVVELERPSAVVLVGGADACVRTILDAPHGPMVHAIAPAPSTETQPILEEYPDRFFFRRGLGLNAAESFPVPCGLVIIDGDHNGFDAINELRLIAEQTRDAGLGFPLVLLSETGRSFGRRETPRDPESIPVANRQAHEEAATKSNSDESTDVSVLTAIEDFIAESDVDLHILLPTGRGGLGILHSPRHVADNSRLREFLDALTPTKPILGLLEELDARRREMESLNADLVESLAEAASREDAARASARLAIEEIGRERDSWKSRAEAWQEGATRIEKSLSEVQRAVASQALELRRAGLKIGHDRALDSEVDDSSSELARTKTVDIVVCVYNALDDVRGCLESVLAQLTEGRRIIVIDDASNEPTERFLSDLALAHPSSVKLVRHAENRGYTNSVNSGLEASTADYVILLNSDTIVTQAWVDRLIACGESDPRIGVIGPLSNAASWQNVPELLDDAGKFAVNELPDGHTPESFAALVDRASFRTYPRVPFVNGFCFALKREVLDSVGIFDSAAFPRGYGEENDYCVRASDAGFTLAIADDAYVFHAKSRSFGHAERIKLSADGKRSLESKHGVDRIRHLVNNLKTGTDLPAVRARIQAELNQAVAGAPTSDEESTAMRAMRGERVLFLLPVRGGGGGGHSVVQEAAAMRRLGVDAHVAVPSKHLRRFHEAYPNVDDRMTLFVPINEQNVIDVGSQYTVVIATVYKSMAWVRSIAAANPRILPAYYVQDYEPLFFEEGTPQYAEALGSYDLLPGTVLFAKTRWLMDIVKHRHGVEVHKVSPSLDHTVYKATGAAKENGLLTVCAMIRPSTPRRGAQRTLNVLARVQRLHPTSLKINIFGCHDTEEEYRVLAKNLECRNHGVLTQTDVAALLRASDIFIDLSDYQAFGRTGLEAMASGCAVINPSLGGADEYVVHGENGLLVDTSDEDACVASLSRLVEDDALRTHIARNALKTATRYSTQRAARSELVALGREVLAREAKTQKHECMQIKSMIVRAKHGAVAGSAFVRILRPYAEPDFARKHVLGICKPSAFLDGSDSGTCDVVLVQRDAIGDVRTAQRVVDKCRRDRVGLVYEVDDLLLDGRAMSVRGYRGDPQEVADASRVLARNANSVITSSTALGRAYAALNDRVFVVPNAIDGRLWRVGERSLLEPEFRKKTGDPIRIGYIGTRGHTQDLELLHSVIPKLQREFGKRVSFEIIGGYERGVLPEHFESVGLPRDNTYPNFVTWVQKRCNWDIGLIPLHVDEFNRCKSYIKWLEYSALGLASVCTDIAPYQEVVRDGENGLLVQNTERAWYEGIKRLIRHSELRHNMASRATQDVREKHMLEHVTPALENVYAPFPRPQANRSASSQAARAATPLEISRVESKIDFQIARAKPKPISLGGNNGSSADGTFAHADAATADASREERLALFKRRMNKLRRNPRQFCEDSEVRPIRALARFF